MLSKQEVQKIAKLARLELTEIEIEKMQKDLSSILDYFKLLQKVKTKNSAVGSSAELKENAVRKDESVQKNSNLAGDLVQAAPDKKDGYIKVKSILQ